jgi:replicative DNA helicase
VPEKVFAQPANGIARFLRHLWSTDGSVHLGVGKNRIPRIYYASSSERLCRDVQSLLLRLGINARIKRVSQPSKGRDQFHVIVSGKPDIEAFIARIGGLGVLKARHEATISQELALVVTNTNRDVIPHHIWQSHALPALRITGLTHREFQAALGQEYCGSKLYQQNISRERAIRVATVTRCAELRLLAESDTYWDKIVSIVADGEDEVYDLTVEGHHNFVAGDLTVHNSIEQDADIVMFIYRDDVYNPESDRKNIADIIIAKHRNGPVGTVSLYFQPAQTRYRDLELRQIEPEY